MTEFRIETKLRPAYVKASPDNYVKVLFHCWSQESEIYAPSVRRGGHNGGVVSGMMAIVEGVDGRVWKVLPDKLKFVPGEFDGYSWGDEEVKNDSDCDT